MKRFVVRASSGLVSWWKVRGTCSTPQVQTDLRSGVYGRTWLLCLVSAALLPACDSDSKEIGATIGDTGASSDDTSGSDSATNGDDETASDGATGDGVGGECDPLATPCPDWDSPSENTVQECEPTLAGDGWSCAPQQAATNPGYGDLCSLQERRIVACLQDSVCVPSDSVGAVSCEPHEGEGCCTEICDVTHPWACPDATVGQTCQPFYPEGTAPSGYEHVGVCVL